MPGVIQESVTLRVADGEVDEQELLGAMQDAHDDTLKLAKTGGVLSGGGAAVESVLEMHADVVAERPLVVEEGNTQVDRVADAGTAAVDTITPLVATATAKAAEAAVSAASLTPRVQAQGVARLALPLPQTPIVDLSALYAEADPVQRLVNRVASAAPTDNILKGGAKDLANGNIWPAVGGTATVTLAQPDRDGTDRAVRLQLPAGVLVRSGYPPTYVQFPANGATGYRFGAWMKSRTGVDQTVRLGRWSQDSYVDVTVGTAWTLVDVAVVGTVAWYPAIKAPPGQAVDVDVYQPRIVPGAVLGTEPHVDGHLYYIKTAAQDGLAAVTSATTVSPNLVQLAASRPLSQGYTYLVAFKMSESTAVGATNATMGLVTLPGTERTQASLMVLSDRITYNINGAGTPVAGTTIDLFAEGWTLAGMVYDPVRAAVSLWVNGLEVTRDTGRAAPVGNLRDIIVGSMFSGGGGYALRGDIARVLVYDRALSPDEMARAYDSVAASLRAGSVALRRPGRVVAAEGDSITGFSNTYADLAVPLMSKPTHIVKAAVYGARLTVNTSPTITSVMERVPRVASLVRDDRTVVATLLIGANDLWPAAAGGDVYGENMALYYADIQRWCVRMRQAGMHGVAVSTVLPNNRFGTTGAGPARRAAINALIRAGVGRDFDVLIDYDTTVMGATDAAYANATYYVDSLHPTAAGYAAMAPVYAAAVEKLFAL